MRSMRSYLLGLAGLLCTALWSFSALAAGADLTRHRDILPLKHGVYVLKSVSCDDKSNYSSVLYYGTALHWDQFIQTDTLTAHSGSIYQIDETATPENVDDQDADQVRQLTVIVNSPTSFTVDGDDYRWCPGDWPM